MTWQAFVLSGTMIVTIAAARHVVGNITADWNPELALKYVPEHPVALGAKASSQLRLGNSGDAQRLARRALENTALSSESFQVLGLMAARDSSDRDAERLLDYVLRLNRRQVPTQIWHFNRDLSKGRVESALSHLDAAMQVSARSRSALYPILGAALSDDTLVNPMTELFARNPDWLGGFFAFAIRSNVALDNLAHIVLRLPRDSVARNVENQAALLGALTDRAMYSDAFTLYHSIVSGDENALLRDTSFLDLGRYPPLDWSYTKESGLGASALGAPIGGLRYYADTGKGGRVARQLTMLPAGSYRLEVVGSKISHDQDGRAIWTISCAGIKGEELVRLVSPQVKGQNEAPVTKSFSVPQASCPAQWVDLTILATFSSGGIEGIIHRVNVVPN